MRVLFYHNTAEVCGDFNTVNCSHKSENGNILHQNISFIVISHWILLDSCFSRVKTQNFEPIPDMVHILLKIVLFDGSTAGHSDLILISKFCGLSWYSCFTSQWQVGECVKFA